MQSSNTIAKPIAASIEQTSSVQAEEQQVSPPVTQSPRPSGRPFHQFGLLPAELQTQIWKDAHVPSVDETLKPRIIPLNLSSKKNSSELVKAKRTILGHVGNDILYTSHPLEASPLLHTCADSRATSLPQYTRGLDLTWPSERPPNYQARCRITHYHPYIPFKQIHCASPVREQPRQPLDFGVRNYRYRDAHATSKGRLVPKEYLFNMKTDVFYLSHNDSGAHGDDDWTKVYGLQLSGVKRIAIDITLYEQILAAGHGPVIPDLEIVYIVLNREFVLPQLNHSLVLTDAEVFAEVYREMLRKARSVEALLGGPKVAITGDIVELEELMYVEQGLEKKERGFLLGLDDMDRCQLGRPLSFKFARIRGWCWSGR